jgi:hypothetical protein
MGAEFVEAALTCIDEINKHKTRIEHITRFIKILHSAEAPRIWASAQICRVKNLDFPHYFL